MQELAGKNKYSCSDKNCHVMLNKMEEKRNEETLSHI